MRIHNIDSMCNETTFCFFDSGVVYLRNSNRTIYDVFGYDDVFFNNPLWTSVTSSMLVCWNTPPTIAHQIFNNIVLHVENLFEHNNQ